MKDHFLVGDLVYIPDLIHRKNPQKLWFRLIDNSYVTRHYLDLVPTHANANMTKLPVVDPFVLPFVQDTILPTEIHIKFQIRSVSFQDNPPLTTLQYKSTGMIDKILETLYEDNKSFNDTSSQNMDTIL